VCVARNDLLETGEHSDAWLRAASLTVPPLGPGDSARLVAELVGTSAHAESAGLDLVERAEGNPLFLEQLAQMMVENESPGPATAGLGSAATSSSLTAVPFTIAAVLSARLERLEPAERRLVEYASVLGRDFTRAELRAIAALDDGFAPGTFDALLRRRLFQPSADRARDTSGGVYRIASALLVEIAYGGMPRLVRAEAHERYARWSARTNGSADLVGTHLERAWTHRTALEPLAETSHHLRREAGQWLSGAGAVALRHGDLHHADDLLRRAAALCPEGEPGYLITAMRLAEARLLTGSDPHWPRSARALLAEAVAAGEAVAAAHLRILLSYVDSADNQFSASLRAAEDALAVFEAVGDELGLARAHLRIGQAGQAQGRYADCGRALLSAVRHAENADSELELATALGGLALSQWMGPVPVAAGIRRCRDLLTRYGAGRRAVRATVNCSLAVLLGMDGKAAEADELLAEALRIVTDMGHAYAQATLPLFQAAVADLAGETDRAVRLLREAAPACAALGDRQLASSAYRDLARALLELGRLDEASQAAAAAARFTAPSASANADLRGIGARIAAARGQARAARVGADGAVAAAWTTDSPTCRATALLDLAHTEFGLGDGAAALDAAERAHRIFARKGHLPGAWRALALMRRAGGETR
jgi:tetratricopeptide (TPR) repeat protein